MRNLLFLLALISFAACNNSGLSVKETIKNDTLTAPVTPEKNDSVASYIHHFNDTTLENRITRALMKLSFVKKSNAYIDSFSNHQHGMAFMLDSIGRSENEISVQAGYNGDLRFETYYHFYVNPKTMEIKVLDELSDKKLSVREFLKARH